MLRQPQGLAKPQVCYETLPVVETFLRDRLPRLLPGCLLSPHSPSLTLYSLPWSLALTHFSLCLCFSLSPALPLSSQQVSSISCSSSPYHGTSLGPFKVPLGPSSTWTPIPAPLLTSWVILGK